MTRPPLPVRLALICTALLLMCAAVLLAHSAAAQTSPRIIESVDVVRTPGHIDAALLFN